MNKRFEKIIKPVAIVFAIAAAVFLGNWLFHLFNSPSSFKEDSQWIPKDKYLSDGSIYCGAFENGKPHGCGIKTFPDGRTFAGQWEQGEPNGLFREIDNNGLTSFWIWNNGVREECVRMTSNTEESFGVDISHYQDKCWGAACILIETDRKTTTEELIEKWQPISFVYMKSTEGMSMVDYTYEYHAKMANRLQIPYGPYHVMQVSVPAISQAYNFCAHVNPWNCELPPVLDLEVEYFEKTLALSYMRDGLLKWLDFVEKIYMKRPLIYTGRYFYRDYIAGTELAEYPIWLADYSSRLDAPYTVLRQTSCKGKVSGWESRVDIDRIIDYDFFSNYIK